MSEIQPLSLPEFIRMHREPTDKAKRMSVTNSTKKRVHVHVTIAKMGNNTKLARLMNRDKPRKKTAYRVSGVGIVI